MLDLLGIVLWGLALFAGSAAASSLRVRQASAPSAPLAQANESAGGAPELKKNGTRTREQRGFHHEVFDGRATLFAAHHKTASAVLFGIRDECLPAGAVIVDDHWYPRGQHESKTTVIHFIRDLGDLVVSSYLYHKFTGEGWSQYVGSAEELCRKTGFPTTSDTKPRAGETYTDFLQRLPAEDGMKAELFRLQHGVTFNHMDDINNDFGFEEMEAAFNGCQAMATCKSVCVEDEKDDFTTTWKGIFAFMEIKEAHIDWPCMQDFTYEAVSKRRPQHVTSSTTSDEKRARLKKLAFMIDASSMNNTLATLNKKNPCKHS